MKQAEVMAYAERVDSEPEIIPDWFTLTIASKESRNSFMLSAYRELAEGGNIRSFIHRIRQGMGYETTPVEVCTLMCIITRLDLEKSEDMRTEEMMFIRQFCEVED